MSTLSIIISTYNRKKWVEDLLISVARQTVTPEEIIIVDSTPESIEYSLPTGMEINLIKSDVMQLTFQRNLGVRAASGDILLHLDDDTALEPDFIENMLVVFHNDQEGAIGAVSGYVTNQWGVTSVKPKFVMKAAKLFGIYDGNYTAGSLSPSGVFMEFDSLPPFSGIRKVDFISGCSFAVRSEVYDKYKHPEVINKYGGEDKIFSRMIAGDWDLFIAGDARLEHYSAPGGARQSNFSETRSTVRFHLYSKKKYGTNGLGTMKLRLYYMLSALRMVIISTAMLISLVKAYKSWRWFSRASGYLVGALSKVDPDE